MKVIFLLSPAVLAGGLLVASPEVPSKQLPRSNM